MVPIICMVFFSCQEMHRLKTVNFFKSVLTESFTYLQFIFFSVKKAYRNLALVHHPDKISLVNKEKATEKFAVLTEAYNILTDPIKRKNYDEGTEITPIWSKKISEDDFDEAKMKYIGSKAEEDDIVRELNKSGNASLTHLPNNIPFMSMEDEPRIIELVKKLMSEEKIKKCVIRRLPKC